MKKATLKDIAAQAGVSAMTVSKALNNQRGVSEATRLRIQKIAKQMNYSQNLVAKGLRISETRTIGVVLSDSSEMATTLVLRGIQETAAASDYNIIISTTHHDQEEERKAVETLISKRIDGLLLVAPLCHRQSDVDWLRGMGVPFVFLMRQSADPEVSTVVNDNFLGGYQSVEHLVQRGCRSFFFILIEGSISCQERLNGYKRAMENSGIAEADCRFVTADPFFEAGRQAIAPYLGEIKGYDALVCGCDTIAIGAMDALQEAGVRVPEDLLAIGYDGLEIDRYLRTPLSTIAQPFRQIGAEGMQILLDRIKYPDIMARKLILKSELIVRQSTTR